MQTRHDNLYFVSPLVDTFFMGGLSILVFLYFHFTLTGYVANQVSESAIALSAALAWVANWPHVSATIYRLFDNRAQVREFALTAWLIPVLIIAALIGCYIFPVSFAPYFLKLYVLWSPYHFSMQTMGITLIYARRAGIEISPFTRKALITFIFSSFLVQYSETEIMLRTGVLFAVTYPNLDIPAWSPMVFRILTFLSLAALAYQLLPKMLERKGAFPWILALPVGVQFLWFVYGWRDFSFQFLVPMFHAIQYMLIAWAMEIHRCRGEKRAALVKSARWLAINIFIGGSVFVGIPQLLVFLGWNLSFSMVMFATAISLHHFFVDGVIWKITRKEKNSPLFTNVKGHLAFEKELT